MSITSFDHFIETLEPVPPELQRNFTAIAELDQRTREFLKRVDECVKEYMTTTKANVRLSLYKESIDLLEKAKMSTDDKVELATQTYDLIDKHIRRLESLSGAQNISQQGSSNEETETSNPKSGQRKGAQKGNESPESQTVTPKPFTVDMPPDPNEPLYCTCQQVSFGEMIACDNKDCPIEWFHFPCVDLKSKPKGKWYCPECYNTNKKWKQRY